MVEGVCPKQRRGEGWSSQKAFTVKMGGRHSERAGEKEQKEDLEKWSLCSALASPVECRFEV